MAYADPNSIHNPSSGTSPPAAWGDVIRDDLEWLARNKPHCRVHRSSAVSIPTGVGTTIVFDLERVDVGGMHSTVTNPSRITVPTGGDGWYAFGGSVEFVAGTTGVRQLQILYNGGTTLASHQTPQTTGVPCQLSIATRYQLIAGDYLELMVIQTEGAGLTLNNAGNYSPEFWAEWVAI